MRKYEIDGVDLSHWNGKVDFHVLKECGIQFAMLKLGGEELGQQRYRIDKKFHEYYEGAKAAGIYVGAYMFAGKECAEWNAKDNVKFFVTYMEENGIILDYPFAIDIESQLPSRRYENTEYVKDWCNAVEEAGYFAMIYGSDVSTFENLLDVSELEEYALWVARYGKKEPRNNWTIWQCANDLTLPGHTCLFDKNYAVYDLARVIADRHLNKK